MSKEITTAESMAGNTQRLPYTGLLLVQNLKALTSEVCSSSDPLCSLPALSLFLTCCFCFPSLFTKARTITLELWNRTAVLNHHNMYASHSTIATYSTTCQSHDVMWLSHDYIITLWPPNQLHHSSVQGISLIDLEWTWKWQAEKHKTKIISFVDVAFQGGWLSEPETLVPREMFGPQVITWVPRG